MLDSLNSTTSDVFLHTLAMGEVKRALVHEPEPAIVERQNNDRTVAKCAFRACRLVRLLQELAVVERELVFRWFGGYHRYIPSSLKIDSELSYVSSSTGRI